jgi:hypothetical protein
LLICSLRPFCALTEIFASPEGLIVCYCENKDVMICLKHVRVEMHQGSIVVATESPRVTTSTIEKILLWSKDIAE